MAKSKMDEKKFSKYFKAFGDRSRLKIIGLLAGGELTVNDIVKEIGLAQPTVSRHLAILREANVVTDRRDGQQVYYSLNKESVVSCCSGFCGCLKIPISRSKSASKSKKNKKS